MIDPQLAGKVVLITGANHGIGAATAKALAMQGAKVFVTFFRDAVPYSSEMLERAQNARVGGDLLYRALQQQSAQPLLQAIQAQGGTAVAHEADLSQADAIPHLFDLCDSELGPADILVNNHTLCILETFDPAAVEDSINGVQLLSAQGIDAHFAVNARAYALLMAEYFRRYLNRGATWGRIVNVSTDAAHSHPANVSYAASKHAIESYSRSAAVEMGKYGVTINVIAPGPIQTGWLSPDAEADIAAQTPLGRVGTPEDIADVVVFLASQQAGWLTGQLLYVGGGWRMPH